MARKPRPLAPAQDSWGGAAPCIGSMMADVAMESEGKAAGGWAAAGIGSSWCCVGGCFGRKKSFPARKCYSRMWICTEY